MPSDTTISPAQLSYMVNSGTLSPAQAKQLFMAETGTRLGGDGAGSGSFYSTGYSDSGAPLSASEAAAFQNLVAQVRTSSAEELPLVRNVAASSNVAGSPNLSQLSPEQLLGLIKASDNADRLVNFGKSDNPSDPTLNFQSNALLHALMVRHMGGSLSVKEGLKDYREIMAIAKQDPAAWKALAPELRRAIRWDAARASAGTAREAIMRQQGVRDIYNSGKSVHQFNKLNPQRFAATWDDLGASVAIRPSEVQAMAGRAVTWTSRGKYGASWGANGTGTAATGTAAAGTAVAETAAAGTAAAGTAVAETATAGTAVAGTAVAETAEAAGKVAAETGVMTTAKGLAAGAAKGLGRCVPGISIGIASLDCYEAGKIQADPNASMAKKAAGWITAGASSFASGASHLPIPIVGSVVAAAASGVALVGGLFRDLLG